MAIIKLKNVTKDYGHNRGIFDVSFEVDKGEVFGFLGPNGAGKTTTIRHLMGFSKPQQGELYIENKDCWKFSAVIKQNVGYLPGELAFPSGMTGKQFIKFMAKERNIKDMTKMEQLKQLFELNDSVEIKSMSLGMKRKLAIVTAFMHDPKILILDEPTSGLDPIMQERFIEFILNEKKQGKTILLSSHIFNEIDRTCDRIAIIKDGILVSTINTNELKKATLKTFKIEFINLEEYEKFIQFTNLNIIAFRLQQKQVKIRIEDDDISALFLELSKVNINFITEIKFTLEDYFMDFYDRKKSVDDGKEGLKRGVY